MGNKCSKKKSDEDEHSLSSSDDFKVTEHQGSLISTVMPFSTLWPESLYRGAEWSNHATVQKTQIELFKAIVEFVVELAKLDKEKLHEWFFKQEEFVYLGQPSISFVLNLRRVKSHSRAFLRMPVPIGCILAIILEKKFKRPKRKAQTNIYDVKFMTSQGEAIVIAKILHHKEKEDTFVLVTPKGLESKIVAIFHLSTTLKVFELTQKDRNTITKQEIVEIGPLTWTSIHEVGIKAILKAGEDKPQVLELKSVHSSTADRFATFIPTTDHTPPMLIIKKILEDKVIELDVLCPLNLVHAIGLGLVALMGNSEITTGTSVTTSDNVYTLEGRTKSRLQQQQQHTRQKPKKTRQRQKNNSKHAGHKSNRESKLTTTDSPYTKPPQERKTTSGRINMKDTEEMKRRQQRIRAHIKECSDVYCSSDDDVASSLRQKFHDLISARARRSVDSESKILDEDEDGNYSCMSQSERPRQYPQGDVGNDPTGSGNGNGNNSRSSWLESNKVSGSQRASDPKQASHRHVVGDMHKSSDYVDPSRFKNTHDIRRERHYLEGKTDGGMGRSHHQQHHNLSPNNASELKASRAYQDKQKQIIRQGSEIVYRFVEPELILLDKKLGHSHNGPIPVTNQSNPSKTVQDPKAPRRRLHHLS